MKAHRRVPELGINLIDTADSHGPLVAGNLDVMVGGQKATFRVAAPAAQRTPTR